MGLPPLALLLVSTMRLQHRYALLLSTALTLLLGACATSPFNKVGLREVNPGISYAQAVQRPETVINQQVLFGGSIINTRNLPRHTEITVLAYPLNNWHRPDTNANALGRFIMLHPGYLESADYAAGRLVSVRGTLTGTRQEPLGQTLYTYPLIQSLELHLWPEHAERPAYPRFHLGVGVGSGNVGIGAGIPIP